MPWAPKSACSEPGCPEKFIKKIGGPSKCEAHQKAKHQRIDANRGSSHARGYDRAWQQLRIQALIRDGWRCQQCGWESKLAELYREMGETPAPATMLAVLRERYRAGERHLDVDHIVPFGNRPERRLDLSNTQALCSKCHKAKSRNEMMEGLGR